MSSFGHFWRFGCFWLFLGPISTIADNTRITCVKLVRAYILSIIYRYLLLRTSFSHVRNRRYKHDFRAETQKMGFLNNQFAEY